MIKKEFEKIEKLAEAFYTTMCYIISKLRED